MKYPISRTVPPARITACSAAATNDRPGGYCRSSEVWLTNTRSGPSTVAHATALYHHGTRLQGPVQPPAQPRHIPRYTRDASLGAEHPSTLAARATLAFWAGEAGDPAAARDQYAALLPVMERVSGAEHPSTLTARANLARWTGQAGDAATARDQYAALVPVMERVSGAEHPATLTTRANLTYWTKRAEESR